MNDDTKLDLRARLEAVIAATVAGELGDERRAAKVLGIPTTTVRLVQTRITERTLRARIDDARVAPEKVLEILEAQEREARRRSETGKLTSRDVQMLRRLRGLA